jgi:hypothetical protein
MEWAPDAGPIPVERHKQILEHNRTQAKTEAEAALKQQYGWALSIGPDNFRAVTDMARSWASDPVAFVMGALDELQNSPQYAPQLRSHVAKILATRPSGNGSAAPQDMAEPQPDIEVDGYSWYSAKQLAERDRWLANKLLGQVRQELGPLQQDMQSRQEQQLVQQAHEEATRFASDTVTTMRKLPYFTEYESEIKKVFAGMPPMPDQMVGQAVRDAYITVLQQTILPKLNSTAKSELLSDLNQKAAASARNPSTGAPAVAGRPKTFEEALRREDARRGGNTLR